MLITFNPSLGETVSFTSPSLLANGATTPLLFTAQLSASDYVQIINDGGHLELWSDIPRQGNYDGTWSEAKFVEEEGSDEPPSGAYTLSLQSSPRTSDGQVRSLYLQLAPPPLEENGTQRFSFTYRIVYSSGNTTWLGAFGENGFLVIAAPVPRTLKGIILREAWYLDRPRQAYVWDIEDGSHALEVMKIVNPAHFHMWALGGDRFRNDLTHASVIFFVPNTPVYLPVLRSSYVLTASPNANISISIHGTVNVSGSGNLFLQVNDPLREPKTFIQQILHDANLDGWDIIGSDANRQLVAISPPPSTVYPIRIAVIPLWSSDHLRPSLNIESSRLAAVVATSGVKEFAAVPGNKEQVHVFNMQPTEREKTPTIRLDLDSTGNDFAITPLYRLHVNKEHSLRSNWSAAILAHHKIVPAPLLPAQVNTLPTPPPSPPLSRAASIPPPLAESTDSQILSAPSLQATSIITNSVRHGDNIGATPQESDERPEDPDQTNPDVHSHPSVGLGPTFPVHSDRHLWVFKYLFVSFNTLFRVIFRFIWRPSMQPIRSSFKGGAQSQRMVETEPPINDVDEGVLVENNSKDQSPDNIIPDENLVGTKTATSNQTPDTNALAETRVLSTECTSEGPDLLVLKSTGPEHRNANSFPSTISDTEASVYAEILPFDIEHYDTLAPKAASVDIVLIPLPPTDASGVVVNDTITSSTDTLPSLSKTAIKGTVSFVDESDPLASTITQLKSFFATAREDPSTRNELTDRPNPINFMSHLIRYQLGWDGKNQGKVISISSPLEPGSSL